MDRDLETAAAQRTGGRRGASEAVWAAVRADYLAGVSGPECCRRHGVKLVTLRWRAKQHGWRRVDAGRRTAPAACSPNAGRSGGGVSDAGVLEAGPSGLDSSGLSASGLDRGDLRLSDLELAELGLSDLELSDLGGSGRAGRRRAGPNRAGRGRAAGGDDKSPLEVQCELAIQAATLLKQALESPPGPERQALKQMAMEMTLAAVRAR